VLAEHCRAAGRDPRDIRKSLVIQAFIGATEQEASARAERIARSRNTTVEGLRGQAIVGTPEQAAEQLLQYAELGVGDFILGARAPYDYELLRLFIDKVAPLVRKEAARLAV
jgi:alkanesulfonate monooxygenase SsuD/methylene tetrahydromethanopterin reductase-like flavin-dependent oxidoreductase (luciferase family)